MLGGHGRETWLTGFRRAHVPGLAAHVFGVRVDRVSLQVKTQRLEPSLTRDIYSIAVTQLFRLNTTLSDPSRSDMLRSLGKPLGTTFLVISIVMLFLGYRRYFVGQHYVIRGKFPASRGTILFVSLVAFAVTVASLVVVILVQTW